MVGSSIFKRSDVRGLAEGEQPEITDATAKLIGQAFGTYLQRFRQLDTVVVGRDNRRTSYDLQHAAMAGLAESGCKVIDLTLVPTPVLYWHTVQHKSAGLMVTGSPQSAEYNGFKFCVGNQNVFGEGILLMRAFIENRNLSFGQGEISVDQGAYSRYIHDVEAKLKFARPLKVVIDAGNGLGGLFAPTLLRRWGHQVIVCEHCAPDGNFPAGMPDPQQPELLERLGTRVRETGADLGVAFDSDADRLGVTDEQGKPIAADRLLALLAQDLLKRHPGAMVIGDVRCSQVLFDAVKRAGGLPFMTMSGHAAIKAKMVEQGALLGGEINGHIFLGEDYYHFDDAFFAMGRLMQMLADQEQALSALNGALPTLYSTQEYRPSCPDEAKEEVVEGVRAALEKSAPEALISEIDGIRAQFTKGWGLLRASGGEAVLSLRFEGENEAEAARIRSLFFDALARFPMVETLNV